MRELDTGLSAQPTMLAGAPAPDQSARRTQLTGFPPELLSQSAARLRTGALLYAFVFFMNNPLPAILFADERTRYVSSPLIWAPSTISILAAIAVAAMTSHPRIPVARLLMIGQVFEVMTSYAAINRSTAST